MTLCCVVFFHWLSTVDRHMMELQIWQDPLRVLQNVSRTNNHPQSLVTARHTINLNLCLQDCSRQCSTVRNALSLTSRVVTIIRASPKRNLQTPARRIQCRRPWTKTSLSNPLDSPNTCHQFNLKEL